MLKHEENSETSSQSAAQKRVTPAELASAIARLEAKREGEADGTIGIGEAVSELGLTATPEAVWAEVEIGRAQRTEAHKKRGRNIGLLILLSSLGLGVFIGGRVTRTDPPERQSPPAAAIALPAPQTAPKPISLDPNLLVNTASNKLVMLSEVGDNQPVQCVYSDGRFQPYTTSGGPGWDLIKHNGQVYVQGWIPQMSRQALQKDGARFSTWSYPSYIPVTLSLDGFQLMPGVGDSTEFHAVNIHLDKYAHEKWQP